ncbi:TonB-dependent receptor [Qipengyuania vesicularis]|uniref:TonB-dependent receptor n=1 Tax=Qipengyuania vesicularis TaxID=2867232 RepID=UPI001C869F48|nr:TonB-dependent receptor [Qipengyuania vesicularis]MBX7528005.1 TonB-dependent receptor [Qipengyuania vesicularis]
MLYQTVIARRGLAASLSLIAVAIAAPAVAQGQPTDDASESEEISATEDDLHNRRISPDGTIIVSAEGLRQFDLLAGASVIEGEELAENMAGQLGEVLASQPGVTATGFAPGASRPILRGFSGERVKVLIDGIGAIDVSNTSADHAVSIDPLTAESIEVLRGPAVLLYGSQAIGGAVNIIDKRIPRRLGDEAIHIDALLRADTASDLREGGASLDVPLGGGFVAHVDGVYRETDDLEVPGFVLSSDLRADLLADAAEEEAEGEFEEAEELREAANAEGTLFNSGTETWALNGGLAFFRNGSTLGVSVGVYDTFYGVPILPGAHHHEEGEEGGGEAEEEEGPETVSIGLRQYRADMRGDFLLGDGFFQRLKLRAGYSDYTHTEFEGDEVGTVFDVEGIEARAELVQNPDGALRGSIGTQLYIRDFAAEGAEAYVAPNNTEQLSFFALQEYGNGPLQLEGALRLELTDVKSVPLGVERDFQSVSGAIGLAYDVTPEFRTGVNLSRVARAPSAEELFSEGPHIATQQFEIGDVDLKLEKAWGVEVFARGSLGPVDLSLAAYRQWFDDFIYLSETGEEEDELPVFVYLQEGATYTGIEGEMAWTFLDTPGLDLTADVRASYIDAELDNGFNVPRIPPLSLLGALEADAGNLTLRGEVEWFGDQDEVAPFETATEGFTFVNASATWRPFEDDPTLAVILKAENIFDETGRRHSSFTKEFVPLAGRNISVAVRLSL